MDVFKVYCAAPDELFEQDPERVSDAFLQRLEGKGLPCDGGGIPGWYCKNCPYKDAETVYEDD
jgi:hypothetical protein